MNRNKTYFMLVALAGLAISLGGCGGSAVVPKSYSAYKSGYVGTAMTDARRAEFTGQSTFGGSIHGYRVTALTPDRRIRVVCQCPESEWKTLQSACDKVIQTLSTGK